MAISNQNRKSTGPNVAAGGKKSLLHRKSSNTSLHTTSTSTNITSIENDHQHTHTSGREDGISSNVEANHPYSVIGGGNRDGTIDRGNIKQICTKRGGGDRNFDGQYVINNNILSISWIYELDDIYTFSSRILFILL